MAHCPAYSGPICSLCCSLETRCRDCCKPQARISNQVAALARRTRCRRRSCGVEHRCRPLSRRAAAVRRRDRRGALARLFPGLARDRWPEGHPASRRCGPCSSFSHHRRRRGVAVRAGARKPPRGGGGDATPDRPADERDRGAQAHRRQAAEGQGSGRSGEQGQEPSRGRAQSRIAHAAQCHPRLCAAPRARPARSRRCGSMRSRSCGAAPSICPA